MPFVFGAAGADELPGTVLVGVLGDLGMSAVAARGLLARMRDDGQLAVRRQGRGGLYRLAGPFADAFRRLRSGERPGPPPPWPGHFHALLYQVPEARRAYRDRLRRLAQLAGFGIMQQGVLIAVRDLAGDLAGVLAEAPPDCRVQPATLGLPVADAAAVARTAWNLDAVAGGLARHVAVLAGALAAAGPPPTGPDALVRLAGLLNPVYVDLIQDPGLPAALLPAGWPRPELDRLMAETRARHVPAAARYIHSLVAFTAG
ncbi:PaaX family transcriptional regulator C-terminal domain-containing protein [Dactylosporangium sp. NPDC049140]|uniref:PaaX family transcriptional regulator C-terminal domain-containing protein n=1 Tax=Dactylosporangium sp. NPDC049140 TaxID=3155647 RepID=UPI0033E10F9C